MKKLVLFDRDGTINVEKRYLSSPEQLELLPGAAEGIQRLRRLGVGVVVVTNQSAIGRGYFGQDALNLIHARLLRMLAEAGATVDAIYVCPHTPDEGCDCRKPAPGLALRASADFQADLTGSFVIGDKECDIGLGKSVGATTILVRTGYGCDWDDTGGVCPDYIVENLLEASRLIGRLIGGLIGGQAA
jgi:D-glycero-D-manno-heptose 1,7-bisphosphate phosphatase